MGKNDVWIADTARVTNTTLLTTDRDPDHLHAANPTRRWQVDRARFDPTSELL
jgi:predicted nucleic acid-binding protein